MINRFFRWIKKRVPELKHKVIPRAEHGISRDRISSNALKVLYRLNKGGFSAYLVGGCIRDLLLGQQPKDFDIATNASPEQIKQLFSNCRLIGRRFRLAHVHFGREIIEVATFRAHHTVDTMRTDEGMILHDNVYGTIEQDVVRRDFTINALYYNIADFSVVDFVDGMKDITKRQLALIGDPEVRYREDPVRMLRAIRFAAKLNFSIHPVTAKPIKHLNSLLANIPAARLFEEFNKLFLLGNAYKTFQMLCEYNLFAQLFPRSAQFLTDNKLIDIALQNTDARVAADKSITPSFLLAVFSWHPMLEQANNYMTGGRSEFVAYQDAIDKILHEQQRIMAVPRRFVGMVKDIWEMQLRLQRRRNARNVEQLFTSPKFRAAYDFLLLRAEAEEEQAKEHAIWWKKYVEGDEKVRHKLTSGIKAPRRNKRRNNAKKAPVENDEK